VTKDNKIPTDTEPEGEDTQRERIEELLDEGYTPVQVEKEWGFPHSTVREVAKKRITPKGVSGKGGNSETPTLPLVLKAGQGQEAISPEAILKYYLLCDGDAGAWMFKGMMLLRAAQLMNLTDVEIMKGQAEAQARAIKPILDVMEQARKDMDAAAARAKESSMSIAEAAAMGAVGGVLGRIDARFEELKQQKADIATVQNPMQGLMARTMELLMTRLTGMVFGGGGQMPPTPGLVDKRVQGG
jgi:hypothetical protein